MGVIAQPVEVERIVLPRDLGVGRGAPADPAAQFARIIRQSLDGPVLRYSQRLQLLRAAEKMGIGRFEANLIIAQVLHQDGKGQEVEMKPGGSRWAGAVMTFLLVQGMILAGVWWLLR